MYCPRCGTEMEDGVCHECGFPETMIRGIRIRRARIRLRTV